MSEKRIYNNIPMIVTRGMFVFPGNNFNLEVGRPKSLEAVIKAQEEFDDYVFITTQKDPNVDIPTIDDLYKFGTICRIRLVNTRDDGSMRVSLEGIERAKAVDIIEDDTLFLGNIEVQKNIHGDQNKEAALVRQIAKAIDDLISVIPNIPQEIVTEITKGISAASLTDMIAQNFPMYIEKKQQMSALEMAEKQQRERRSEEERKRAL